MCASQEISFLSIPIALKQTGVDLVVENLAKQNSIRVFAWTCAVDRRYPQKGVYPQPRHLTRQDLFLLQPPGCNDTVKRSQNGCL
jgi:hypothetical protein